MEIKRALEIIEEEMPFTSGVIEEAMDTIRDVVAKQTPEKVMPSCYSSTFKRCPRYGEITMDSGKDNGVINAYCQRCGQALDWSDNLER
jgi:hypothetical protein